MAASKRIVWIALLAFGVLTGTAGLAERSAVPSKPDDRTIVHVLNRLGFGAAPGDIDRVRRIGLQTYIDQQLDPGRLPDAAMPARLAQLETLTLSTRELASEYFVPAQQARRAAQQQQAAKDPSMTPDSPQAGAAARREMMTPEQTDAMRMERQTLTDLMQAKILRAAYSERQLEEVMVDFWFNHFNVFSGKGPVRLYLNEYEREAIRPHVFGKFHDLLKATAESPAMLFYLDNWQSAAPEGAPTLDRRMSDRRLDPRTRGRFPRMRQPNRPLPPAGAPGAQARRRGLNENYARELMELHTLGVDGGYTQKDVQEIARAFTGWTIANPRQGGSFLFEPRIHDAGEKIVLGRRIKSGGGKSDGDEVLALLATHPSTAKFIATKLARRFVADDPPKALVDRAAKRFLETGGSIRDVVRTIVTSPEFFAAEAHRAKVKSPFEFVVSAVRATGVDLANAMPLVLAVRNLGMPLYGCQPPTGYADKAEAWVNSGALLSRMNFAVALTTGNSRGDAARLAPRRTQPPVDISSDALIASALAGELSESTAATVAKAAARPQALALVLGSPEFQRK